MPANNGKLKFKKGIEAPPEEVYAAFTNSTALCDWLCNAAQADPRPGGRIYLWWNNGYYACGEYTQLEPDDKITFIWQGRQDPDVTLVKVKLEAKDGGTQVRLVHSGVGSGKAWKKVRQEIQEGWEFGLENLRAVLETGQDLRIVRSPLLGISGLTPVNAENAAQLGLSVEEGLWLDGVLEGMGAEAAGLQQGDVLVKFGGDKVKDLSQLLKSLDRYRSGDQVKVVYSRDGEKYSTKLTLSQRLVPEVPDRVADLAQVVRENLSAANQELEECCAQWSEEQASARSNIKDWGPREILAHLISNERETHAWMANLIEGQGAEFVFLADHPARIGAIVSAYPTLKELLEELKRNQQETLAMISNLQDSFVHCKRSYWRLGSNLLEIPSHYQAHIRQMRRMKENETVPSWEEEASQFPEEAYDVSVANASDLTEQETQANIEGSEGSFEKGPENAPVETTPSQEGEAPGMESAAQSPTGQNPPPEEKEGE